MTAGPRDTAVRGGRPALAAELHNAAGLSIELLDNGTVHAIRHGAILINQVLGSPVEGGLGNLWVRRRSRAGVSARPLIGPAAAGTFRASADGATWEGERDGLASSCTLRVAPRRAAWFWTVRLTNVSRRRMSVDAVLAQDLGIAEEGAVRASELYTSQYIDHTVLDAAAFGFLICSRQNLPQEGAFPWVMHGCLDGAVGYLTDGFQFYGLDYKATNVPVALGRRRLANRNYQYEFALPTLQSRALSLPSGASGELTFFATLEPDHPQASGAADARRARAAAGAFRGLRRRPSVAGPEHPRPRGHFDAPVMLQSDDLGPADLERFFGSEWRHVERQDGRLWSFFHGRQQHVVLKAKELAVERPTGHIMRSGRGLLPSDTILSVTAWMFGVFASHFTIGNTSFNKLLGVCRNPLNVLKSSGQRVAVRTDRGDELLGVPSAFEMGPNSARWIYRNDHFTLAIRTTTSLDKPICRLEIEVDQGGPLRFVISNNIVVGANEYDAVPRVVLDRAAASAELRPGPDALMRRHYPEAVFVIASADAEQVEAIGGGELLDAEDIDPGAPFVVVQTKPVTRFSLVLTGSLVDPPDARRRVTARPDTTALGRDPSNGDDAGDALWIDLGRRAALGGATGRGAEDVARLNDLLRWYLHNAMVHYTTPHGLEQHSGAAWGLRDVCQGPVELLVATSHFEPLRAVIRTVYEHQDRASGDWPQWFMFDRYREVRAADSHADIIHWPMKALCDYIEASSDLSILDERVAYTDTQTKAITAATETIFDHTERQVAAIERDCIPGTALPMFAGGDWEDTLQPADPAMAREMVSAWTVELAYQTLVRYRAVCDRAGKRAMAERLTRLYARIRADFQRHLVPDGVVAGLAHFGRDGIEYFLHPRDRRTGVSYRLLPMTRGMISGLFTPEQARRHAALIKRHLTFPDGVRLMDRPMEYRGGRSRTFKRAESAANFGREIGLQYVHAHIRYVEAMARIGRPDEAFQALLAICPIRLDLDVPSALPRQANAFFSSSDAAFLDRRQASRQFDRVRTGRIGVKGGWRIYSSGPGIFLNQLISNVLGIRTSYDDVVLDPVLPRRADGLTFDFAFDGRRVQYRYHVAGDGFSPREVRVNGRPVSEGRRADNPYRTGGLAITRQAFGAALDRDDNVVEIVI